MQTPFGLPSMWLEAGCSSHVLGAGHFWANRLVVGFLKETSSVFHLFFCFLLLFFFSGGGPGSEDKPMGLCFDRSFKINFEAGHPLTNEVSVKMELDWMVREPRRSHPLARAHYCGPHTREGNEDTLDFQSMLWQRFIYFSAASLHANSAFAERSWLR